MTVAKRKELKAEPLSVTFDNFVKSTMRHGCARLEGFVLTEETQDPKAQEVLLHYEQKLLELYDKLKIAEWSHLETSHYFSFGRISLNGKNG